MGTNKLAPQNLTIINGHITMLILTRRIGQTLSINNDIKITLVSLKGNQARIGIDAPKDIEINRDEISEDERNQFQKKLKTPGEHHAA